MKNIVFFVCFSDSGKECNMITENWMNSFQIQEYIFQEFGYFFQDFNPTVFSYKTIRVNFIKKFFLVGTWNYGKDNILFISFKISSLF